MINLILFYFVLDMARCKIQSIKNARTIKSHISGTGGVPSTSISLSDIDEKILAIFGSTTIAGHDVQEHGGIDDQEDEFIEGPKILEDGGPIIEEVFFEKKKNLKKKIKNIIIYK